MNDIENIVTATPVTEAVTYVYSRFYTRPDSPFNFDPYMSYPPAGTCLVHQTTGDASITLNLRGALPAGASLNPQPNQTYNNGSQTRNIPPRVLCFSRKSLSGKVDSTSFGLSAPGAGASFTIDPAGPNQEILAIKPEPPPAWSRPNSILVVTRSSPLSLSFTPGDPSAPTAILLNAYAAAINSTVEVKCLAAPGAGSITIPSDILANLPSSYRIMDASYANLYVGTLGLNHATSFTIGLAANGVFLNSNWISQAVVLQ